PAVRCGAPRDGVPGRVRQLRQPGRRRDRRRRVARRRARARGRANRGRKEVEVQASTATGVEEIHILWTSEGMSCDGDTVSITAAQLPRIEDVVNGNIPGLPKVHLHNKVLSPTLGGDEFLAPFFAAARGELGAPFIFVVEGSIP